MKSGRRAITSFLDSSVSLGKWLNFEQNVVNGVFRLTDSVCLFRGWGGVCAVASPSAIGCWSAQYKSMRLVKWTHCVWMLSA